MAATKFTHPQTVPRDHLFRVYCVTCRTYRVKDGRFGARNSPYACSLECRQRLHVDQLSRELARIGIVNPFYSSSRIPVGPIRLN